MLLSTCSIASAQAVLLPPLTAPVPVPAMSTDAVPAPAGAVLHDELAPFTLTNRAGDVLCQGNLQNRVVQSDDGQLEFQYRVRDTTGPGTIGTITASGFSNQSVHVAYRADGSGAAPPSRASRSLGLGETVTFAFQPAISCAAGGETQFMIVATPATAFHPGGTTRMTDMGLLGVWVSTARP